MNKKEFTAVLNVTAQVNQAEKTISGLGDSVAKLWKSGNAPKSMLADLESLRERLASIKLVNDQVTASGGLAGAFDLKTLSSDAKGLIKDTHDLQLALKLLTDEQKRGMLSDEEKRAWEARSQAMQKYMADMEKMRAQIAEKARLDKELESKRAERSGIASPILSQIGEKYAKLQEAQQDLKRLENTITTELGKGTSDKEGRDNVLTRALSRKREIEESMPVLTPEELEQGRADFERYNAEVQDTTAKIEALDEKIQELSTKSANIIPDSEVAILERFKKALSEMGVEGAESAESIDDLRTIIKKLDDNAIQGVDDNIKAFNAELEKLANQASSVKDEVDKSNQSLADQKKALESREAIEQKIKDFLGIAGAAKLMRSAIRDAISTITELDATMTQMAVVTDLTVGDYWDQLPEYSKQASELGVSINSAYEAATLYYQQGLKGNEVTKISAQTLKMAKIAGISAADATDKMTAALRGFNMELNETSAQKIADVYSKLAAITAADVNEISDAMTKTASIASSAGMEFETTAAFLSQIIETTRESAETAGTAMKTVIARFQELKKSPDEIGEIDGEIVDANAIETALRSVGVSLRDAGGQFRDLDDVFLELSKKWSTLDKNTQRYIATIAAGSRQQSRFIAMMQDYGRTQELVNAATNSAGASNMQFEKTMESLEAKVEKLKNAWHEFTMGILEEDFVKMGVDALTKFLEILNKATERFNGLGGSIVKIASILTIFKVGQKIFNKFKTPVMKLFDQIIEKAGSSGYDAGKAFYKGMEDAKKESEAQANQTANNQQNTDQPNGQTTQNGQTAQVQATKEMNNFYKGLKKFKNNKAIKNEQKTIAALQAEREKALQTPGSEKKIENIDKKLDSANKNLATFQKQQEELGKDGKDAWQNIGEGVANVGSTITNVGVTAQALGAILSEIGLEEFGEDLMVFGQYATLAGTAVTGLGSVLQSLPAIFKAITSHPYIAMAVIIFTAIASLVIGITAVINKNSPANRLKRDTKALQEATEVANRASESYELLSDSLENLGDKYKTLEDLTEGTKEWNQAVRDINQSVLDLIKDFPELASLVKRNNGVLTLDIDSDEVQEILQKAESQQILAQNAVNMANLAVQRSQNDVAYTQLSDNAKFAQGDNAYRSALIGTTVSGLVGGAITGAVAGNLIPLPGVGALVGGIVGGIAGGIGGLVGGFSAANVAKQSAQEKSHSDTDKLAKALAEGTIRVDEKNKRFISDEETMADLGIDQTVLNEWYDAVGENSEELRVYGQNLINVENQQMVAYAAIAQSAQNLANTLNMTSEEIARSNNVVDENFSKVAFETKLAELQGVNFYDDGSNADTTKQAEAIEALQASGYTNARIEDGKVKYQKKDANGIYEDAVAELTNDQIANIVANYSATQTATTAIENSAGTVNKIGQVLGQEFANSLYDSKEGGSMTYEQAIKAGQVTSEQIQAIWNEMSKEERKVYHDKQENLANYIRDTGKLALNSFSTAQDVAKDFMTASMAKGLKEKIDAVIEGTDNANAGSTIQSAIDNLLSGKENSTKAEIQSRINATDWTSLENLLALQIDLETEYGYTTEQAKAFVKTLGDTAQATHSVTAAIDPFGELWKATEKIAQSTKKLAELQWEYNRAVEYGQGSVKGSIDELLSEYSNKASYHNDAYNANLEDLTKLYAQGGLNYGVDLRDAITLNEYGLNIDQSRIGEYVASKKITQEQADAFIKGIKEAYATSESHLESLREDLASIEELEQQGEDAYIELQSMIKETLLNELQEQIEIQKGILDATENANQALIDKVQEQIDAERELREKEEAEKNIADLQSQLSYLMADTSGANGLQFVQLQEQIKQAQQEYQDSIIDKALQDLSDANEKAFNQRERQISLAEQQLDIYKNSSDFQSKLEQETNNLLDAGNNWEKTEIGSKLSSYFTVGMSATERKNFLEDFNSKVDLAASWKSTVWGETKGTLGSIITSIQNSLSTIAEYVPNQASNYFGADNKGGKPGGSDPVVSKTKESQVYERSSAQESGDYVKLGVNYYRKSDLKTTKIDGGRTPAYRIPAGTEYSAVIPFKTGGLANFTGPAWLDGTPSKPEYVLNARQTERFFSLIDVLESYNTSTDGGNKKLSGDNYFEIQINVEKIEDDYDIEQMANKIRSMIYEDATYRNVNAINHIR